MEEINIEIRIRSLHYDELNEEDRRLIEQAKEATQRSYAPYSRFSVGAAALLANGETVSGSNQENAASPSGLCAERVVLFAAHAQCPNIPVMTLAIAAYNAKDSQFHLATPCGACRQVIAEFQKQSGFPITLLLYSPEKVVIIKDAGELLPLAFDFPQ